MTRCFNGIIINVVLQKNIARSGKSGEMSPLQIKAQRLLPDEKINNYTKINEIAL